MKKTVKTKLRLNTQTIRSLLQTRMQEIQGGRLQIPNPNTDDTAGCRGCG